MAANIRVIVIALRCPAPRSSGRTARNSAPGVARDESGTDPKSDRHFMVKLGFGECSIGKMLALPMRGVEGESARGCGIVTYQNQLKIRAFDGIGAPGRSIFLSGFNTENSEGGHREHREIQREREMTRRLFSVPSVLNVLQLWNAELLVRLPKDGDFFRRFIA